LSLHPKTIPTVPAENPWLAVCLSVSSSEVRIREELWPSAPSPFLRQLAWVGVGPSSPTLQPDAR